MTDGIKVDYIVLNQCIASLQLIIEDKEVADKILELGSVFSNSSSETTDALKLRQNEYSKVNDLLDALATNLAAVLKAAKRVYEQADLGMSTAITEG